MTIFKTYRDHRRAIEHLENMVLHYARFVESPDTPAVTRPFYQARLFQFQGELASLKSIQKYHGGA